MAPMSKKKATKIEELPIKINNILYMIDRIHNKYPLISKTDMVIIINALFDVIRELLLNSKIVSINGLFAHAYVHKYIRNRTLVPKVKLKTPRDMK